MDCWMRLRVAEDEDEPAAGLKPEGEDIWDEGRLKSGVGDWESEEPEEDEEPPPKKPMVSI